MDFTEAATNLYKNKQLTSEVGVGLASVTVLRLAGGPLFLE